MPPGQPVGEEGFGDGIDRAPGALLVFKAAACADKSLHGDKSVLGMAIGDEFMVRGKGADPNPGAGENTGLDHGLAQLFAQSLDIVALVELGRILDRKVRHAHS